MAFRVTPINHWWRKDIDFFDIENNFLMMSGKQNKVIVKGASSLLVILYLLLALVSHLPQLHSLIHKDANSEQHHCAITLISQSQVLSSDTAVCIVQQPHIIIDLGCNSSDVINTVDSPSNFSRAPPFVS